MAPATVSRLWEIGVIRGIFPDLPVQGWCKRIMHVERQTHARCLRGQLFPVVAKEVRKGFDRTAGHDQVLMAEILKWYYPSHVELHNYVSASSLHAKKENWSTLNWKVFARLNMRLSKGMIHHLASASQGTIERLLWQLRIKILGNGEDVHRSRLKCSTEKEDDDVKTSSDALVADATAKQVENVIEETVPRTVYADLKQELREKEELTRSLNHKIAYLESSMKLKDLRISTLSEQIPQNAVEMDQLMKPRPSDSARSKLRVLRSQNFHETKTN
ncbi:Sperm flagellar protein [Ooceraea biroi]|uniref:Sperm flagellar protein n=1 Tax=Ooceraea biroi TaxID=2015173 RepID=A0A026WE89_OOCBI|nr:Sperm flagellar protein [Ooceraea biroi]